jgi:transcriptional regulator with XRE-family HTH domain
MTMREKIKKLRLMLKLNQIQFSEKIKRSLSSVQKYEYDKPHGRYPSRAVISLLKKMTKEHNIDINFEE